MSDRLRHDAAWAAACSLMESFRPLFREEEVKDGHTLMYHTIKSAIEAYDAMLNRQQMRLRPSSN